LSRCSGKDAKVNPTYRYELAGVSGNAKQDKNLEKLLAGVIKLSLVSSKHPLISPFF